MIKSKYDVDSILTLYKDYDDLFLKRKYEEFKDLKNQNIETSLIGRRDRNREFYYKKI